MRSIPYIFLLTLIMGCDYLDNLTTSSERVTKEFYNDAVQEIIVNTPINLTLSHQTKVISASGQKHLINDLILDYSDRVLTIDHPKRDYLQKSKLIEITINADMLSRITVNKVMNLKSEELISSENLNIVVNGTAKFTEFDIQLKNINTALFVYGYNNSGNYRLSGTCDNFQTNVEGSVNINASDLTSVNVKVKHKSIGMCKVHSQKKLDVETYSSGNTYYLGEPSSISHQQIQISRVKPSGQLIKL